jgi:hypothetical protein
VNRQKNSFNGQVYWLGEILLHVITECLSNINCQLISCGFDLRINKGEQEKNWMD